MFRNYILKELEPYIAKHKSRIKWRFGNWISFRNDDDCYHFTEDLSYAENRGTIPTNWDFVIQSDSQHRMRFVRVKT